MSYIRNNFDVCKVGATMTIGEWQVDDAGMITHLKCKERTWAYSHRCWGYITPLTGHYIQVTAPEFIQLLSKNTYEVWDAAREIAARIGVRR